MGSAPIVVAWATIMTIFLSTTNATTYRQTPYVSPLPLPTTMAINTFIPNTPEAKKHGRTHQRPGGRVVPFLLEGHQQRRRKKNTARQLGLSGQVYDISQIPFSLNVSKIVFDMNIIKIKA